MQIRILGKTWTVQFCKLRKRWGTCSDPNHEPRTIQIDERVNQKQLIEYMTHEMLHGAGWHIDEAFVKRFAKDVAAVIHDQLGYRRMEGE